MITYKQLLLTKLSQIYNSSPLNIQASWQRRSAQRPASTWHRDMGTLGKIRERWPHGFTPLGFIRGDMGTMGACTAAEATTSHVHKRPLAGIRLPSDNNRSANALGKKQYRTSSYLLRSEASNCTSTGYSTRVRVYITFPKRNVGLLRAKMMIMEFRWQNDRYHIWTWL